MMQTKSKLYIKSWKHSPICKRGNMEFNLDANLYFMKLSLLRKSKIRFKLFNIQCLQCLVI